MKLALAIVLAGAAGCSSILGIDDLGSSTGGDGGPPGDGSGQVDAPPGSINVNGFVELFDGASQPAIGARVEVRLRFKNEVLGSSNTDSNGAYTVSFLPPASGEELMLVTQLPGVYTTFLYMPGMPQPVDNVTFTIFNDQGMQRVAQLVNTNQSPNLGAIHVFAAGPNGEPVSGAVVDVMPSGQVAYSGFDGFPKPGLNGTDPQASSAWVFNAAPDVQLTLRPSTGTNGTQVALAVPPMTFHYLPMQLP